MNPLNIKVIALALGLAFSAGALADSLSIEGYKAGKEKIATEYKAAKGACALLTGNPKDVCVAEAKGQQKVARAELEATYKPTPKTRQQALLAKAEADAAIARERCDDLKGEAKPACVKEAKAAEAAAKADAKGQMKKTDASEKSATQ